MTNINKLGEQFVKDASFENAVNLFGEINKQIYGVNSYERCAAYNCGDKGVQLLDDGTKVCDEHVRIVA